MQNYSHTLRYDDSPSKSRQVEPKKVRGTVTQSFENLLDGVKRQIDISCFRPNKIAQAEEIALIIAEVMRLPPDTPVRIAGEIFPAEMVAAIYKRITHGHVEQVMINFGKAAYEIRHIKTYLRTALYNAVFECEARVSNDVASNMIG